MGDSVLFSAVGGLGLFLLGMVLLTDSFKALAGRALRDLLTRFVSGPVSGLTTGAVFTALVQSSSATTLTTIGFVSAGLITFPQAIGVVFGANIGTTSTGWIVSLLGLKVSLGALSPPLILIGVLLRLFTRERMAALGMAIAGFALIFVGIDAMQSGMEGLADRIGSAIVPAEGIGGRLTLVGIGLVMTVVMQSSSAAVAATLVAVHTGAIDFEQAAALVIGQNIGTTVTASIASIGASVAAKRTALAHILFNVITGIIAFLALPLFTWAALRSASVMGGDPGPAAIAAFHTIFNVVGVIVLLPAVRPFSSLVTRLVRSRGGSPTAHLDPTVATLGSVGLEAARLAAVRTLIPLTLTVERRLGADVDPHGPRLSPEEASQAIEEIREFLGQLSAAQQTAEETRLHLGLLHATDHLDQLLDACRGVHLSSSQRRRTAVAGVVALALRAVRPVAALGSGLPDPALRAAVTSTQQEMAALRRAQRVAILQSVSSGQLTPSAGTEAIDAIRWMDRVVYHVARCVHHLVGEESVPAPGGLVDTP